MRREIVLLGPPGSGKGTQARRLAAAYGLTHIASGDVLRAAVDEGSALGQAVEPLLARGQLVPDEILLPVIVEAIAALPSTEGFVLDGVPRTVGQARALTAALAAERRPLDAVALLDVADEVVAARLRDRGRADDTEAVIADRLAIYHRQIDPIVEFYEGRGLLRRVVGDGTPDEVFHRLVAMLGLPRAQEQSDGR